MDGGSIPPTQHKGSYANTGKGGKQTLLGGGNLKTDPGGKAYEDSEWALKTNGGAIAKNMPLLMEYANYGAWETEAMRRPRMLYNRPISSGIYYVVNNLMGRRGAKIDVEEGGFLKHKAVPAIEANGKSILRGGSYDPFGYEWMCRILKAEYQEPEGAPIVRLTKQLGGVEKAITRELEVGVRNPEGGWDWIGKKRRGLKSRCSNLASREMCMYFKDCSISKSRKSREVIERHCLSLEFVEERKKPDAEKFKEKAPNYIRTIGEHLNSE